MLTVLLVAAVLSQSDSPPPLISAEVEVTAPLPLPPPPPPPPSTPKLTAQVELAPAPQPPPLVSAQAAAPQPAPAPAPVAVQAEVRASAPAPREEPSEVPVFHLSALAVGGLVPATEGTHYTAGAFGELDLFRVGASFAYERTISSTLTVSDTQQFVGMLGYSVIANQWLRVRALGGVNVLSATSGVTPAPVFATNARLGFKFLAIEGSAALTPLGFREFDTRAAVVLCAGAFEVRGGYRARLMDTTSTGSLSTLFASQLAAGPFVAFGFTL